MRNSIDVGGKMLPVGSAGEAIGKKRDGKASF